MIKRVAGIVLVAVLAGFWIVPSASAAPESVKIVRDSHGEPHVYGQSAKGAMYGFAYAQMQDMPTVIMEGIYQSTGRSAEIEGPDCLPSLLDCFKSDQTTHLFRIPEVASEKFATLPAGDQARFTGFAAGLNQFIADHPEQVPEWARNNEPISPQDVLANGQWRFVMAQLARASRAFAGFNPGPQPLMAGVSGGPSQNGSSGHDPSASFIDLLDNPAYRIEMNASNMFVLDGTKTANGKPIVNAGPHLQFEGPTEWYQAQVTYPGVSVSGSTFSGSPAIGIGNNGHVAWSHTSNQGAIHEQDAYKEKLTPGSPNSYEYGGSSRLMTTRTVDIKAQTAPGVYATIPVAFRYTVHGPVVTDPAAALDGTQPAPGTSFAGTITASQYEQVGLASEMWRQAESTNIAEFKQAMSNVQLSQFNTMAADQDGNIFYVGQSRSGVLNPGVNVNQLLDGSVPNNTWVSSDLDRPWTGVIPFVDLPQAENAPSGFYQNANNTPWTTAPGQISINDVPYYMRLGNDGTRSRRQRDLLTPASNLTLADVDEIAFDNYVEFAPVLKDLLDEAATKPGASQKVIDGLALLNAWDNRADRDNVAFPLFVAWVRDLDENKLGKSTPQQKAITPQQVSAPYPDGLVGQPGGYTAVQVTEAGRAMEAAYDAMIAKYGSISKRSGDVHTMDWGDFHSPIGGGTADAPALWMTGCKNSYPASVLVAFPCSAAEGSGYMMDVDFSDGAMHTSKPTSASDDPASPFFTSNADDFANERFRNFPLTDSAVQAEKTSETSLVMDRLSGRTWLALMKVKHKVTRRGWLATTFRCKSNGMKHCSGRLGIHVRRGALTRRHLSKKRARKLVRIAKRDYSISLKTHKLNVRLGRNARKALRRHKIKVQISWSTRQADGKSEWRHRWVKLRAARR